MTGTRTTADRIRATVAGLAAGDAMSWPAWWHRIDQLPPRRAVRLDQAATHARDALTTSVPTPYLQSSAPSLIDPAGPTDDAEWFVVGVRHVLGQRLDGSAATDTTVWTELADRRAAEPTEVRGRISVASALANLAAGMTPPASGNDNPHYFDDHAMVRAIAAGLLCPGASTAAADLAERDAEVTHALDGVWGARATAALVASLVAGQDVPTATAAAQAELPDGSWIANVVAECLVPTATHTAPLALAADLEREVVDHVYAYANQAPETLGLLLAHLAVAGDGPELLLGALGHPRHADALVPLAAAVAGATFGDVAAGVPTAVLSGTSIRALRGVDLGKVAEELVDAVGAGSGDDTAAGGTR